MTPETLLVEAGPGSRYGTCSFTCTELAHVPEELRLKKIELNRAQTRVHNFIEFIASAALADALSHAEEQVKSVEADIASMEGAQDRLFTPSPRCLDRRRSRQLTPCWRSAPSNQRSRSAA